MKLNIGKLVSGSVHLLEGMSFEDILLLGLTLFLFFENKCDQMMMIALVIIFITGYEGKGAPTDGQLGSNLVNNFLGSKMFSNLLGGNLLAGNLLNNLLKAQ